MLSANVVVLRIKLTKLRQKVSCVIQKMPDTDNRREQRKPITTNLSPEDLDELDNWLSSLDDTDMRDVVPTVRPVVSKTADSGGEEL